MLSKIKNDIIEFHTSLQLLSDILSTELVQKSVDFSLESVFFYPYIAVILYLQCIQTEIKSLHLYMLCSCLLIIIIEIMNQSKLQHHVWINCKRISLGKRNYPNDKDICFQTLCYDTWNLAQESHWGPEWGEQQVYFAALKVPKSDNGLHNTQMEEMWTTRARASSRFLELVEGEGGDRAPPPPPSVPLAELQRPFVEHGSVLVIPTYCGLIADVSVTAPVWESFSYASK